MNTIWKGVLVGALFFIGIDSIFSLSKYVFFDNNKKEIQQPLSKIWIPHPKNYGEKCEIQNTVPYLDPRNINAVKNILNNTDYPLSVFIKNPDPKKKYSAKEIQKISQKISKLYQQKFRKKPFIFIDNEGGIVQRVKQYPEISFDFSLFADQKISQTDIQSGKISIQTIERIAKKITTPENRILFLKHYAQLRIAQEQSLGLNTIPLVLDTSEKKGVILSRGFLDESLKKQYANILISEAEISGMQVLIKHFPGHLGQHDPHTNGAGTKNTMDQEIQNFLEILEVDSQKKNITVMLGHIKMDIPEWQSFAPEISDKKIEKKRLVVASQSKHVAQKLWEINPNILLITDDIDAMKASGESTQARKNAEISGIATLN